jgi:hypothetical protein
MKQIEQRVSQLINSSDPKQDLQNMCRLQIEHAPHLTQTEAKDYVILGLIESHKDHELDHLWYQFKNLSEETTEEAA